MKPCLRTSLVLGAAIAGAVVASSLHVRGRVAAHIGGMALDRELLRHLSWFTAAIVIWGLLSLYWEIAAAGATAGTSAESTASRAFHVGVTNVAIILVLAPVHGVGRLWSVSTPVMAVGLIVEALGAALALWARRVLDRNWSGRIAIHEGQILIRSGPYKLLRHPIYSGFLIMSAGAALVTGERLAVAGLLLVSLAYWRKIRLEESKLCLAFGPTYETYRQTTWALLPGVF